MTFNIIEAGERLGCSKPKVLQAVLARGSGVPEQALES